MRAAAQIVASIGAGECLNRAKIISGARAKLLIKAKCRVVILVLTQYLPRAMGSERARERERDMFSHQCGVQCSGKMSHYYHQPAEQEEEGAPAKVIAAAVLMPLLFRVFRRLLQDALLCSHTASEPAREHMASACSAIAKRRKRRCSITRAPSNYCRRAILALLFQNKRFCDRETDK
jgi:hypothetical protein